MRALVFAALAKGKSRIVSYLRSPDTDAMVQALRLLGVTITENGNALEVTGGMTKAQNVIDAKGSGQVLRFIGAISALQNSYSVITGDHAICHNRPLQPLIDGLSQLGAFAASYRGDGFAPLIVRGPLSGGKARIVGYDSQPVSGLLMAAAFCPAATELLVDHPGEKPWVSLTLDWFQRLGISYTNHQFEKYTLSGNSRIDGFSYEVPGDWSSASYPVAAALVTGSEVTVGNVDIDDVQGDKEVIFLLQRLGAEIDFEPEKKRLFVRKSSKLQGGIIDVNDFIDALPLLAVLGCYGKSPLTLTGAAIARMKECDRLFAIATELKKMGAHIEELPDGLIITPSHLTGAQLSTYNDHRIALSLAVAALGAKGPSEIQGAECAAKSYGDFFSQLKAGS